MMRETSRQAALAAIGRFDGHLERLGEIVRDLNAIWHIEEWDQDAKRMFRREWGVLEEIYAAATNRLPPILTDRDRQVVAERLAAIRKLIDAAVR